ncbi:MAG TPA: aldehyde dehydrogenase family protein [Kofleriaceae bacterium]|jgi:acyl-CoA reductase-like NAD-dependent aldehyde dehydrogenase
MTQTAPQLVTDAPIARTCPIDLRPLPVVPRASADEIRRVVAAARDAQARWSEQPFAARAAMLQRAAKSMLARRAEVMAIVKDEMGKLDIEALFDEGIGHLDMLTQWIRVVRDGIAPKRARMNPIAFPGKRGHSELVPRGVVGVIAPWNFPVAGLYRAVYPSLLCGNGCVVKPSEYTPRTTQWLVDSIARELPPGLLAVVHGGGAEGEHLIDAGIDACAFTGSPATGRKVAVRCAERGIPSSVEMGGKDCAIVLADCDRERTVAGLTHWALANVGQACGAVEVALVDEQIADELAAHLASAWTRLQIGPGPYADISPLGNRRQFDLVVEHVRDAVAKGAKLVCGGSPTGTGLFFQPTILDHCTEDMKVVRDETFGPVLAIVRVDGAADAVRRVNRARYGLGTSIWTRDVERAQELARRLDVGIVSINNHSFTGAVVALPWSGTRETGFGVANSVHALATFARPKAYVIDSSTKPDPFWMPWDRELWEFGNLLCDAQLMKLGRAWKIPLIASKRVRTIREFFKRRT